MRINKFKGLYTNIDPNDAKLEYLLTADNVDIKSRETETKFYAFEEINYNDEIEEILLYEVVEIDNDKLQSKLENDTIIPTYHYSPETKHLLIGNDANKTRFFIDDIEVLSNYSYRSTKASIFKDQGNILILLDEETLWLGKLDRHVWTNGELKHHEGYYIDRYLEPFDKNNQGLEYKEGIPFCKENRRLGFGINVGILSDGTVPLQEDPCKFTFLERHDALTSDRIVNLAFAPDVVPGYANLFLLVYNIYRARTDKNEIIYSDNFIENQYHFFPEPKSDNTKILIPRTYFKSDENIVQNFKLKDGSDPDEKWDIVNNIAIAFYQRIAPLVSEPIANLPGGYYLISKNEIEEIDFIYIGKSTIELGGFEASYRDYEMIITSILDNKEEIVTEYRKGNVSVPGSKYGIKIQTEIPSDVNSRLTGISYYIRFNEIEDYKQIKTLNLLSDKKVDNTEFNFGNITLNGIEAVQTLGILFNVDTYNIIHSFDYFERVNSIPFVAYDNQIYGAVSGSGKVLDLFYKENRIPNITSKKIMSLSNVNDIPAVHDNEKTILLQAIDSGIGQILYSKRDTFGMAIKDKYDIATSPDGVALHSKEGIFTLNGSSIIPLSKEIDDIIEHSYETGKIFFNNITKELYYLADDVLSTIYRYSFVNKNWTTHTLEVFKNINEFQNITIEDNGSFVIVTKKNIYQLIDTDLGKATIITHFSDLGRARELKSFMGFRFDFKGILSFQDKLYEATERTLKIIKIPIHGREPKEKIAVMFHMINKSKLFSLEIYEETVGIAEDFTELPTPVIEKKVIEVEQPLPHFEFPEEGFELHIPMVGNVTANTAIVVWATTHYASSRVVYGLSPDEMTIQKSSDEKVKYHSLVMDNLELEQLYYCKVFSVNNEGIEISSDIIAFFTGKEVTIQVMFSNPELISVKRNKTNKVLGNVLTESEILSTLDADAENDIILINTFKTADTVKLTATNIIGTEISTQLED